MSNPHDYSNTIAKAASRARGDRLTELYGLCEKQTLVSTKKLKLILDKLAASDRLDAIHFRVLADEAFKKSGQLFDDKAIEDMFYGTNFGEPINRCTEKKRRLLKEKLKGQCDGCWCGLTIYRILVNNGLLVDFKHGANKKLTALGERFLSSEEGNRS